MTSQRRDFLKLGTAGLAGATMLGGSSVVLTASEAAAQSRSDSLLRKVLNRGKVIVGTGSTNAPWHFEDESGKLVGMDIAMGQILAKALYDDEKAVEFVQEDPAQRIPNVNTGKVDIVIQFMTISGQRAQLANFSRPYYVEGVALLSTPSSKLKTYDELVKAGSDARVSILQNVGADETVHQALPKAQVLQLDTQANVIQAAESHRVDAAAVDLSTVGWLTARHPDRYFDCGKHWRSMLYGAAMKQGDLDWLYFVNTVFTVAMFGHENSIYDPAFKKYFGNSVPERHPGFPKI